MRTVTSFETVKAELERRGMWRSVCDHPMPNQTIAFPERREIFYVQEEPPLAGWGQYDTDDAFTEALNNLTTKRWFTSGCNVAISVRDAMPRIP